MPATPGPRAPFAALALLLSASLSAHAQSNKPPEDHVRVAAAGSHAAMRPAPEDYVRLAAPGALDASADGRLAAFTIATAERDTAAKPSDDDTNAGWKRRRQIAVVDLATRAMRVLTTGDDRAGEPRFSPDASTLAFTRKGALWLLPLDGGEARKLDTGKLEPASPRWSPDGRTIAFLATEPLPKDEKDAKWRTGGVIAWDREWRPARLWVVPAAGGAPRALSADSLHVADARWSPDGTRLAVITSGSSDPYEAFNHAVPRVLDAADGRVVATLARTTDSYGALYANLAWTPDGRHVVLTGLNGGLSNPNALLVWNPGTGAVRDLAPDRDWTFDGFAIANGGRDVIANVKARTESKLVRFPLAGGAPQDAGFAGRVLAGPPLADAAGRWLVFLSSTPDEPQDVTVFEPGTRRTRLATTLNPQVSGWARGETQRVRWTCPEGVEIEGLLTRPPGAAGPTPLMVMPHGGPDDVTQQSFSAQTQLFAVRGYAVFRPNYRGGTGYGFAFYEANRNRFGEIEQMDIESGVDALVERGLADPRRLFYGGWSWGGYITAWTIGHVQRYRAAVVGAGVNDVSYSFVSSDINHGVAAQWEYRGDPWRQTAHFDRANPVRYAKDMRTPTLILHGQADDRVNFMNGVTLYRALSDVGCEVEFFAYPREPHGFAEPAHQVHRWEQWLRWYDTHGGAETPRP